MRSKSVSTKGRDTIAGLAAELLKFAHPEPDQVPPGWHTKAQLAEHWQGSTSMAAERISRALKAGAIETKEFRIKTGRGVYPTPHYRLSVTRGA